jgi:hypothetical protein
MKKLIYILLLFSACKGPDRKVVIPVKEAQLTDTVFIERDTTQDYYHAVYIEKDRLAKTYKALQNFKYDHNDSIAYNAGYKVLKVRYRKPLKKYNITGLPKEWLPLYLYKGNYYLYSPCNTANIGMRVLTDSTLIYYSLDGPEPKPILDFKKLNTNKYALKSLPIYQFVKSSNIIIYIIDPEKMIAVWEDKTLPEAYRYKLYVAKESAGNFDMVVNQSVNTKLPEYQFDKVDFKALLKGK